MTNSAYAALDEALDALKDLSPDLANGMTSHAPMVAEALCAMVRPQAVMPWLRKYATNILPWPKPKERIAAENWRAALGQDDRVADWRNFFREELKNAAWPAVLDKWVDRLAPGICAAATHGVIRVGHAVRALTEEETLFRRDELGDALASWAASYQELPTPASWRSQRLAPEAAMAKVAIVPPERRRYAGSIVSSLRALSDHPDFAGAIALLDDGQDPAVLAPQLAETFAQTYLANARDGLTTIVFIHGVTSVAAFARIAPHVAKATARRALPYAWQAGAGLYAAFGMNPPSAARPDRIALGWHALIDEAVAHGDDHVIKFTEACRRFDTLAPSPVYAAAAAHAMGKLARA